MEIKQINNPKHSNDRVYDSSGISPTLNTMQGGNRQPFIKVVAHDNSKFESNGRIYGSSGISPCQSARQYKDPIKMLDEEEMRIRKLTPTECERLMAWPDNFTKYGTNTEGKTYEMSNTRRYKHCGNGIVSSVSKHFVESLIPSGSIMSLCSGVDGSCLALDKTRFTTVGFSEFDEYASDTLRYHYPNIPNFGDLTKIVPSELPEFNILFASLPCQTFSIAGQRKGLEDTRGTLFYDMARILQERKPEYFVFENVKGLLSHDGGKTFEIILETFCELGYKVDFEVLNAKYFGVAQNRERIFMIGKLDK